MTRRDAGGCRVTDTVGFKRLFLGAIATVIDRWDTLLYALLLPLASLVLIDCLLLLPLDFTIAVLLELSTFPIGVIATVTTHRVVLLGANSVGKWGITRWSRRETRLLLHALAISSLLILPSISLRLLGLPLTGFVQLALVALGIWLMSRLSLVLPGISIDRPYSFRDSWQATRNHQRLMLIVTFLVPLVIGIPVFLVSLLPFSYLLTSIASTIATLFVVTALSIAYLEIERPDPNINSATTRHLNGSNP